LWRRQGIKTNEEKVGSVVRIREKGRLKAGEKKHKGRK
jgi:hypothetical protein